MRIIILVGRERDGRGRKGQMDGWMDGWNREREARKRGGGWIGYGWMDGYGD